MGEVTNQKFGVEARLHRAEDRGDRVGIALLAEKLDHLAVQQSIASRALMEHQDREHAEQSQ